jgi:DNA-binding PadR family transcriptional regulator
MASGFVLPKPGVTKEIIEVLALAHLSVNVNEVVSTIVIYMSASSNPTSSVYWRSLVNQSAIRFFILRALWDKDSYGYILSREIEELSWGFCTPTESTLYPALNDLEKKGLIHATTVTANSRQRKIYHITEQGKLAFRTAAKTWGEIIPAIRKSTTL